MYSAQALGRLTVEGEAFGTGYFTCENHDQGTELLVLIANELSISEAEKTLETINIEIDISWNSTSINSSAQAPASISEVFSNTTKAAEVWIGSSSHSRTAPTSTQSVVAWSSSGAHIRTVFNTGGHGFKSTDILGTGSRLASSAPTASLSWDM